MTDLKQLRRLATQVWNRAHNDAPESGVAARRARFLAAAAMLGGALIYVLFWDVPSWAALFLFVASAAVLAARSSLPVFVAFVWAGAAGLLLEARLFVNDRLRVEDWLQATALLALLLFGFRCLELQRGSLLASEPWWLLGRRTAARREAPHVLLHPLAGAALRLIVAPGLALLLLGLAPWQAMEPNQVRLIPSFYRMIVFFWALAIVGLLLSTAFSMFRWRRLTPRQAALYARWVLADEARREQMAIERARARRLRKRTAGE